MQKAGKGTLLLVTALVLSLGLVGSVSGQSKRAGRGGASLTPEQAGKVFDLKEKFNADTISLRRQITVKMAEVNALEKAEKPDTSAIEAKKKELELLKGQWQEKMTALQQEIKKIAPEMSMGPRPGPGMPGHGMGKGPGAPPPPAKQPGETPPPPAAPPAK